MLSIRRFFIDHFVVELLLIFFHFLNLFSLFFVILFEILNFGFFELVDLCHILYLNFLLSFEVLEEIFVSVQNIRKKVFFLETFWEDLLTWVPSSRIGRLRHHSTIKWLGT